MAIMNILMGTNGYPQEEINLESEAKKIQSIALQIGGYWMLFGKSYTDIQVILFFIWSKD